MATEHDVLRLSARHLGPIMALDGELTKHPQNLIFARNGTGKSFLSRALRCFDQHSLGADLCAEPLNLVSDESENGRGELRIFKTDVFDARVLLDREQGKCDVYNDDLIFHVFSEDFIAAELREQSYNINGNITTQIALDSDNIEIAEADRDLAQSISKYGESKSALSRLLTSQKETFLVSKAGVRKTLREYGEITFEDLSEAELPETPPVSSQQKLLDLDALKGIPAEPEYPDEVTWQGMEGLDWELVQQSLRRETSLSSVADEFKAKIESDPDFFRSGFDAMAKSSDFDHCPFCEQEISHSHAKDLINSYTLYFSDAEESHKSELRQYYSRIQHLLRNLSEMKIACEKQRARFDVLKAHLPSRRSKTLTDLTGSIAELQGLLNDALLVLREKGENVASKVELAVSPIIEAAGQLQEEAIENNSEAASLNEAIRLSDSERKQLHRQICVIFRDEFLIAQWSAFETLGQLKRDMIEKTRRLETLQRSAPSQDARTRVARTFDLLIRIFFSGKYIFDQHAFTLKRGDFDMTRGPEKTLSDGEKATIAFCYFLAAIHKKVSSHADYARLFLVFDDPVTSMSYDYIFSIAQTLKSLSISRQGDVSFNPGDIDGNLYRRPQLLILTHNTYFFNISLTNKVVKGDAAFSLSFGSEAHSIACLKRYVAPFQEQLRDVVKVAGGSDPDHTTANSVRSVLEAVGRFCRPDKTASLSDFIIHLAGEEGISIRSVLINSFSHGTYVDEVAPPDDLRLACQEAITVVERYASGQLNTLD